MEKDKIICTIHSMKNGMFDNDYTFYEDGRIKHFYDQNQWSLDIEEWITPEQISNNEKKRLINECSKNYKSKIEKILSPIIN